MKQPQEIRSIIEQLQQQEGSEWMVQEETLLEVCQTARDNPSGIAIKVLTIAGGLLASLAFVVFLFIVGLANSEIGLLIIGLLCIAGAILLVKMATSLIVDTLGISAYVVGGVLFCIGLAELHVGERLICAFVVVIAVSTMLIVQNYVLSFIAVLAATGSILFFFADLGNRHYLLCLPVVAFIAAIGTMVAKEASILAHPAKRLIRLYSPVLLGLTCSLLASFFIISKQGFLPISFYWSWIPGLAAIAAICCFLPRVAKVLEVNKERQKLALYVGVVLVLSPAVFAPAIAGSIFLMLVFFLINFKTGFALGVVALLYFIIRYYYDWQFTLLTKSMLMMVSGGLFIGFYLLTRHKLQNDEEL